MSSEAHLINEGGFPDGSRSVTVKNTGVVDVVNSTYQIDMESTLEGSPTVDIRQWYVANDTTYNYVGGRWSNHPVSPGDWNEMRSLDLTKLSELLDDAKVELVGTEDIENTSSYVIEITPDLKNLYKVVMNQPESQSQDPDSIQFWDNMGKSGSAKLWVATESHAPVKAEHSFNTILTPGQFGQQTGDAEIKLSQSVIVNYFDFNKAKPIEVPAEALATP